MDAEYIREPKDGLLKFGPEVVEFIRKECCLQNKEDREKAIAIVQEWVKQQDHFVKKNYDKGYIERCLITCKGSIERTKQQIDRMCTMRTFSPQYFQITSVKDSDLMKFEHKVEFSILPKLTKEYYRVVLVKSKPDTTIESSNEIIVLHKFIAITAEYLKSNDYCRGYIVISDIYDINFSDVLHNTNIAELRQFNPIVTAGYGCKIKGLLLVTNSKLIESFLKVFKTIFSEKIASRIHAVSSRESIKDYVQLDVLPKDYGGPEKPIQKLHEIFLESISSAPVQELLEEMNQAVTDESKRQIDKFNEQYMGMPGTFRSLSLD